VLPADNWKVCDSLACRDYPFCAFRPWKNGKGKGGDGYVDYDYSNKDWSCANNTQNEITCEGRCSTVLGVCPTSSCIANALGKRRLASTWETAVHLLPFGAHAGGILL
jgi:hypothetical protein